VTAEGCGDAKSRTDRELGRGTEEEGKEITPAEKFTKERPGG